jgi:cathepsin A (carboxypeptidase C)
MRSDEISPLKKKTLIFWRIKKLMCSTGDVDPCVSYEGTRNAIEQVGFNTLDGGAYRPWFFDKKAATVGLLQEKPGLFGPDLELNDAGSQFGGHVVNYEHGLSFATVHGAGHMVPQFRPLSGSRVLSQLLANEPFAFAPPLPTDEQLSAMSWSEFDTAIDTWTDSAKETVA